MSAEARPMDKRAIDGPPRENTAVFRRAAPVLGKQRTTWPALSIGNFGEMPALAFDRHTLGILSSGQH